MRYTSGPSFGNGPSFGAAPGGFRTTPWVKRLLLANAGVFLVTMAVGLATMADLFAFAPGRLFERPWGMLTYMFVHAGLWHLLMNLLALFFFGPPLESRWGSDFFVKFYFICGLGGVLLSFVFADAVIVGASAACYGVMLAFAMTWPNAPIHIWGVVPVRAKWVVGFLAAMSLASAVGPSRDGVAHLAHLGGVVTGFLVMKSGWAPALWGEVGTTGRQEAGGPRRGPGARGRRAGGFAGQGARGRFGRFAGMGARGGVSPGPGAGGPGLGLRAGLEAISARLGALVERMRTGGADSRPGDGLGSESATAARKRGPAAARGPWARTRPEGRAIPMPPVRRAPRRPSEAEERAELDALDAVLDKISESGMGSLTDSERALLDRVSRRERTN